MCCILLKYCLTSLSKTEYLAEWNVDVIPLREWFSKCGSRISTIGITCGLVGNADSWTMTYWISISGNGAQKTFNKLSRWFLFRINVWEPLWSHNCVSLWYRKWWQFVGRRGLVHHKNCLFRSKVCSLFEKSVIATELLQFTFCYEKCQIIRKTWDTNIINNTYTINILLYLLPFYFSAWRILK